MSISDWNKTILIEGQYAISKPFPFFILIILLIQAMQACRRLIFCQPVVCWLVSYGDENEYGNDNGNEIEDWPIVSSFNISQ